MNTGRNWRPLVAAVVLGTVIVAVARLSLYTVLAPEWMAAQRHNVLIPLGLFTTFCHWNGATALIAIGLALGVVTKRSPGVFLASLFVMDVVLLGLTALVFGPMTPFTQVETVVVYAFDATAIAAGLALAVWASRTRGPHGYLQAASLIGVTPVFAWSTQLLTLLQYGEFALSELPIVVAPLCAPAACIALAAHRWDSRSPAFLGAQPVQGWMAIPLFAGLQFAGRLPLRILSLYEDNPAIQYALYTLQGDWIPSAAVASIVMGVTLAFLWRGDAVPRERSVPRWAVSYLVLLVVALIWAASDRPVGYLLKDMWSGSFLVGLFW